MPPRLHLSSEQRREETVKTVISICAEDDPARITTAEIAKRMEVTQGALFRHFANKDAIWEAVVGWVADHVMQRLDAASGNSDSAPLETLQAMFSAHIEFIKEYPGVPRLLFGQLQTSRMTPARRMVKALLTRYRERVELQLLRARAQGELRQDLNLDTAVTQYIGMIQGLVVQSLILGDFQYISQQAVGTFDLFCSGICTDEGVVR